MKHISFALLALATTSIRAAQPVNTNPCYAAGEAQNYAAVLNECPALAAENDMFAHFFMATAIINSKTKLTQFDLSETERAKRTFNLPTEEKIAISDAKQHLKAAVEQGHTNSHFLLGYILLETKLNMLPPSGRLDLQIEQAEQLLQTAAEHDNIGAVAVLAERAVYFGPDQAVIDIKPAFLPYLQQKASESGEQQGFYQHLLSQYQQFANQRAATLGNPEIQPPEALRKEGWRLLGADSVEQQKQGMNLLLSAATRGDAEADYMLARLAENHKNQTKALEHYTAAATKGYARAMFWLGEHFACNKDNDTAYNWLQKAKAAGDRDAQDAIDELNTYGDLTNCVK